MPRHSAAPGWDWRRAEVRFLTEAELQRFGRVEGPLHETLAALARLQTHVLAVPDHLAALGVETAEGSTFWTASLLDADGEPEGERDQPAVEEGKILTRQYLAARVSSTGRRS